ncbi:helix-turn-helix domain-containing protein [Peribacillus frigoritolerans]|uniref:helix-turn-helix domain-containing protein n=1 Tax=Peribacillus castrilensis TaxID=2897690 RepID=UPI00398BBB80
MSRYFKQAVGVSFSQYVKQTRLKSAVHELLYTDHTIMKVSLNNGFPNVKAFNKALRKCTIKHLPNIEVFIKKNLSRK